MSSYFESFLSLLFGWPLTYVSCLLILQLCRFTTPLPHLAVYSGITDTPLANTSPPLPFLTRSPACPSPISVALDSTSASERRPETSDGDGDRNSEAPAPAGGKSRVALSLRRLLKRGCSPSAMFASLSPKCHAAAGTSSRIQPITPDEPSQAPSRNIGKYVTKNTFNCHFEVLISLFHWIWTYLLNKLTFYFGKYPTKN